MSTFSSYKIELIGTGEQTGQWGNTTNDNLQYALQQSIGGYSLITLVSNAYTLPYADTTGLQDFRSLYLDFRGSLSAAGAVTVPAIQKTYIVANNTVGGFTLTLKVSGQTGVTVPNGSVAILYCNGTDVVNGQNYITSLTLGTPLPAASGGMPTQTGYTSRFLTTDGTTASWGVTGVKTVKAASTVALTLSTAQTVDGVALVAGDRILVKNQASSADNGVYVVAAGSWTRASDFDTSTNAAGSTVNIQAGTVNGGLIFTTGFKSTDTLGVSPMTWVAPTTLPSQTNNANKNLGTDGTVVSWVVPAAIIAKIATTAAVTTTGVQVIDGITTTTGDRVLVKNQGSASGNGIYIASAGAWSRSNDMSTATDAAAAIVVVQTGTTNGGKQFATTFKSSDTLNTTAMNWYQVTTGTTPATTGGTGLTSYAIGDLLYADSTTTLAKLADVAVNNVLTSGGVGAAPAWGKVGISALSATGTPSATTYLRGDNTWATVTGGGTGTVTSVAAGNGMNFTTITATGTVTMGTPTTLTTSTTNATTATSHTHAITVPTPATFTWTAGTSAGPTGSLAVTNSTAVSYAAIPSASATASGVITTGTQTVAGAKTFSGKITAAVGSGIGGTANPSGVWGLFIANSTTDPGLVTFNNNSGATGVLCISGLQNPCNQITFQYSTSSTAGSGTQTEVGKITTTNTATAYGTGSDYRLKENVVPLTDAITKIKLLAPKRFTWKAAPEDQAVEGFIAHEVQEVVPAAVVGAKDAVDENGKDVIQTMDASFLIPLLTAALQEAVVRIEALETRLANM